MRKILGIGLGSIGQRHFKNLHENFDVELIAYRRRNLPTKFIDESVFTTYSDLDRAFDEKPDAVIISNPTSMHIQSAIKSAKNDCHLFIEKPLSHNLVGMDELISIVEKKNLVTLMGCNLRFHPSIKLIKDSLHKIGDVLSVRVRFSSYLPDWHPWEDYRNSYSAKKSLGGGVILTCIHELDYLHWLLGDVDKIFCYFGNDSGLEMDAEDNAEMIIKFKNGIVGNVHLDFYSKKYKRECDIIGEKGNIHIDLALSSMEETYIDEMRHFLNCLDGKEKSINDIYEGKKVLELALAAKKSSERGEWIEI